MKKLSTIGDPRERMQKVRISYLRSTRRGRRKPARYTRNSRFRPDCFGHRVIDTCLGYLLYVCNCGGIARRSDPLE
ncbi:hypothetical protein L1987_33130 [Smallanthus sonchifolius]|uniref:Uncharacterized protein n=1 Tax=Smallanthus sonchifolius TaxID=185202 RepID=A0ACB9HRE3_9ASTR|nr:hypothetical protein L1987_33130 [Smallanthus sonchifolius]